MVPHMHRIIDLSTSINLYLWLYARKYFVPVVQGLKNNLSEFIDTISKLNLSMLTVDFLETLMSHLYTFMEEFIDQIAVYLKCLSIYLLQKGLDL